MSSTDGSGAPRPPVGSSAYRPPPPGTSASTSSAPQPPLSTGRKVLIGVLLLALAGGVINLFDGGSNPDEEPTAEELPPATSVTPNGAAASAAQSSKGRKSKDSDASAGLTGWGATRSQWDTTHRAAAGYAAGSAYLPMARTFDGEYPKYAGVIESDAGVIQGYTINAIYGTDLAAAKTVANSELRGARLGEGFRQGANSDRCTFFVVDDKQLRRVLGALPVVIVYFYETLDVDVAAGEIPRGVEYVSFTTYPNRASLTAPGKTC